MFDKLEERFYNWWNDYDWWWEFWQKIPANEWNPIQLGGDKYNRVWISLDHTRNKNHGIGLWYEYGDCGSEYGDTRGKKFFHVSVMFWRTITLNIAWKSGVNEWDKVLMEAEKGN